MAHIHGKQDKIVTRGLVYAVDGIDHGTFPGKGSSSTTYGDLIGQSSTTLQNDTTYRYHKNGIITLDRDNGDYISTGTLAFNGIATVSIGMWARFREYPSSSTGILMEFGENMNNETGAFQVFASSGNSYKFSLEVKGNTGNNQSDFNKSLVNDGLWHYLVFVFDKSQTTNECSLFVDGTQATAVANPDTNNNTNTFGDRVLYIGGRKPSSGTDAQLPWTMDLGPLHIYKVGLTAAEVTQNYNLWKSRFRPSETAVTTDNSVIHVDPDNSTSYGGSGSTFTDLSGNNNNGTISGATFVSSTTGSAFDFDGSNDDIEFANWDDLVTSAMTYTCWFKTTNTSEYYLMAGRSGADNSHLTFAINRNNTTQSTGRITAYIRSTGGSLNKVIHTSDSGITDGEWHCIHLACTNNSQQLYLDGVLLESGTNSWGTSNADSLPFTVGALRSGDYHFNGEIGHVHVRNVALTSTQVKTDYNALAPRYLPGHDNGQTDAGKNIATGSFGFDYDFGSPICNPGSGTTITDLRASNNATISSATYSKANGGVLDFNGSSNYVDLTTQPTGVNPTFSFSFWLNFDSYTGQHRLVSAGNANSGGQRFFIGYNNTSGTIDLGMGSATITPSPVIKPTAGDWFNLVVTNASTTTKFYLNGSLVSTNTHSNSATIASDTPRLGRQYDGNSEYFNGKMASVTYQTRELSAAEILSNYNATKSRFGL